MTIKNFTINTERKTKHMLKSFEKDSRLDLISARDIKCWKLNESIEIKMSSNLKKILKNLECVEE